MTERHGWTKPDFDREVARHLRASGDPVAVRLAERIEQKLEVRCGRARVEAYGPKTAGR